MSRLNEVIKSALDKADRDWQHSIAPTSVDQYIGDMADAVEAAILAEAGDDHVVRLRDGSWTLQHPVSERFDGTLLGCVFNDLLLREPMPDDGEYVVSEHNGHLRWGGSITDERNDQ